MPSCPISLLVVDVGTVLFSKHSKIIAALLGGTHSLQELIHRCRIHSLDHGVCKIVLVPSSQGINDAFPVALAVYHAVNLDAKTARQKLKQPQFGGGLVLAAATVTDNVQHRFL